MTVVTLPASPEAVARGCRCPVTTNNGGHEIVNPDDGRHYWVVDADCPLHGYGAAALDESKEQDDAG